MTKEQNIIKRINYCWFGGAKKGELIEKCIKSWKEKCPDYEIIEWNEQNFDVNINRYVKEAYSMQEWAFVSDYARLWIIYNNGGVYLDTDVELLKSLDPLLEYDAFFASEDNLLVNTGLGFGAKPGNKLVKKMLDDYEGVGFIKRNKKIDRTTCVVRNSAAIQSEFLDRVANKNVLSAVKNQAWLPKDFLCPLDFDTKRMNVTENTMGIHWYNGSFLNKKDIEIQNDIRESYEKYYNGNNDAEAKKKAKRRALIRYYSKHPIQLLDRIINGR